MRYDRDNYALHRDHMDAANREPAQRAKSVCEKAPLLGLRALTYALILIVGFVMVYAIEMEIFHG